MPYQRRFTVAVFISKVSPLPLPAKPTTGIFTGADLVVDKVIATGDKLFGSTVTNLQFSRNGFNDAGQIAFIASLGNGRQGLFLADPEAQVPASVPEPGSIVGLGLLGLSTFLMRKRALS